MSEFDNLNRLARDVQSGKAAKDRWTILGVFILVLFVVVACALIVVGIGHSLGNMP